MDSSVTSSHSRYGTCYKNVSIIPLRRECSATLSQIWYELNQFQPYCTLKRETKFNHISTFIMTVKEEELYLFARDQTS